MPELDEMKISDMTTAPAVADNTLLETSVEDTSNPGTYGSYKATLYAIFDKVLNSTQFTQRLPHFINQTVFGAINELNDNKNIADLFNPSGTYAVDDYVIYNGTLYKCISAVSTAGAWDASKWSPVVVTDEMGQGGGGNTDYIELTQAEYDALEQAGTLDPTVLYFITDGQSGNEIIDDTTTSASKVWSSDKTDSEIQAVKPTFIGYDNGATPSASEVQNTSIASGGGQSHANVVFNKTLDPGLYLGHIMIRFAANDSGFRRIYCSVNDGSNAYGLINSVTEKAVSANVETYAHLIVTLNPDVQTTYSFCAYQDSGSTLTVEGRYAFIKLL